MRNSNEMMNFITNSTNDYLQNFGITSRPNQQQSNYYEKLAKFLVDGNGIDTYKPLLVTGISGGGKTTPMKALFEKNKNFGYYFDFKSFRSFDDYCDTKDRVMNFRTNTGVKIDNDQALNVVVIDNFGIQMNINNFGQNVNVVYDLINHIHELNFSANKHYSGCIKHNKFIIVTGLSFNEIINVLNGNEHLIRRFIDLFPETNRIEFK